MLLTTAIVFILILGVLVLVHEFGHFITAKMLGIKVEEFGFGLPPRIWGKKHGETIYSINWLPIGGFVKLFGEEEAETDLAKKQTKEVKTRAFFTRSVWQRAIILTAGVFMNFFLAVVIISYLFTTGVFVPTDRVHIEKVLPETPAEEVGLTERDIIKQLTINHQQLTIKSGEDLTKATKEHLGKEIKLLILRPEGEIEKEMMVKLVPRKEYPSDQGPMGIVISNFEEKRYPLIQAPFVGLQQALFLSWELTKAIGQTLWKLISFQPVASDVAGPVGIAQITGEAVRFGRNAVLELLGLLSLNLAIINILPFPALDGGRLLFVAIEGVTGKKIKAHWEHYVHQVGMAILLALIILITINDLVRIFSQ